MTRSAGTCEPSVQPNPLHPPVSDECVDADAHPQVYAMPAMQFGPASRHLLAQRAQQRGAGLLDEHHVQPERSTTRGDLGTDESASDHDYPRARAQSFPNRQAIIDRAEHQHPVGNRTARPFARECAASDHQSVEFH